MKNKRILTILLPAALALMLAAGAGVKETLAYFTSYAMASGTVPVDLKFADTQTGDDVRDWTKHISVTNTGDVPCFVRVKVLVGKENEKYVSFSSEEGSWKKGEDGYWYYDTLLNPGESTTDLLAALRKQELQEDTPNGEEQKFNVIVVQEHTVALYGEDGMPYADWTMTKEKVENVAITQ